MHSNKPLIRAREMYVSVTIHTEVMIHKFFVSSRSIYNDVFGSGSSAPVRGVCDASSLTIRTMHAICRQTNYICQKTYGCFGRLAGLWIVNIVLGRKTDK